MKREYFPVSNFPAVTECKDSERLILDELNIGGLYIDCLSGLNVLIVAALNQNVKGKIYNPTTGGFEIIEISNYQLSNL